MKTQFIEGTQCDVTFITLEGGETFTFTDQVHQRVLEVNQVVLHFEDGTFTLQGKVLHRIGNRRVVEVRHPQNNLQVLPARVREEVAVAFLVYELEATPADELIAKMLAESIAKLTA